MMHKKLLYRQRLAIKEVIFPDDCLVEIENGNQFCVYQVQQEPWSGEGLPPVGTVCEYHVGNGPWFRCNIRYITTPYHDNPIEVVMFAPHLKGEQTGVVGNESGEISFRPIRTPAQLAAEEREEAIKQFMQIGDICWDTASALYDAGARLPGRGAKA